MLPPRPLLALCVLLVGGLAWSTQVRPAPEASVADLARWDGQTVRVAGWASEVRPEGEGLRFRLLDAHAGIDAHVGQLLDGQAPMSGDRVEATGRVSRWQGALRLDVEDARGLVAVPGPRPTAPAWAELAAEPDHWQGVTLVLRGTLDPEIGRLAGPDGSVALGTGPWPKSGGAVEAIGLLRADASCLCQRFDAREVRPWTS